MMQKDCPFLNTFLEKKNVVITMVYFSKKIIMRILSSEKISWIHCKISQRNKKRKRKKRFSFKKNIFEMFLLQLNTVLLKKKDTVSWYPWWKEKKKILSMSVANEKCRWWHNLLSRKFPKGSVCLEHDADEQDEGKMKDEDDGKRRGECLSAALSQAGCGTTTAYALHTRFCLPDRIWAAPKRDY